MQKFVKPSKAVTDGHKISFAIEAAANEISSDVGRGFDETLAPWVEEGETPPSPEEQRQVLLARWLRHLRQRMVAADEAHQASIRLERIFRRQRQSGAGDLEAKIRVIRSAFEKVYGKGLTADVIGVASDIPEDPVVLQRYARRIIHVMSDPELELPIPAVLGSAFDPVQLIEDVNAPLAILEDAVRKLAPQKRKTQIAAQEKREAIEAFKRAQGRIARYLEAVCFLAGKDFHAERVRQSSHLRLEPEEEVEEPEADAESGASDGAEEAEEPEADAESGGSEEAEQG